MVFDNDVFVSSHPVVKGAKKVGGGREIERETEKKMGGRGQRW